MLKRELISHNRVRCGTGARVGELAEDVGRDVAIVPACHSRLALDAPYYELILTNTSESV